MAVIVSELQNALSMQGRVTKKIHIANIYNETPVYLENVKTWVNAENAQVGKEHIKKVSRRNPSGSIAARVGDHAICNSSWAIALRTSTASTRGASTAVMITVAMPGIGLVQDHLCPGERARPERPPLLLQRLLLQSARLLAARQSSSRLGWTVMTTGSTTF